MSRPLRLAVIEQDGSGGLIHYAYQLSSALHREAADVTLFTGRHFELAELRHPFEIQPVIPLWPAIEDVPDGVGAIRIIARKFRRVWRAVRYAWAWEVLTRRLIAHRPDVALFSVIRFPFQIFWLRRISRSGIVMAQICHEFEPREVRGGLPRRLGRRWAQAVYPLFSAIFLHGEANRSRFRSLYPSVAPHRTHVIPHGDESMFLTLGDPGGDLRRRYAIPKERPVALFFGGIRPTKGVADLIEAFGSARHEVEATLLIVGHPSGVDPADLARRATAAGVGDDVIIDPHYLPMDQIGPLMRTATAVVLPYRSATASGVLQVAYAFERPVIVTETGGLPEAVDHGATGLIVPPEDRDALARALVKLLSDPTEAAAMGRRGRAWSETAFGWDGVAASVLATCRSLLPERVRS